MDENPKLWREGKRKAGKGGMKGRKDQFFKSKELRSKEKEILEHEKTMRIIV